MSARPPRSTELPPDVLDAAAKAAHDAFSDVALGDFRRLNNDRSFEVSITAWRAAVDAVAETMAAHTQMQVLREMMKGPAGDEQWTLGLIVGRISTRILELERREQT